MKKIARRDRLKIYGDLLGILYAEKDEKIVLTRVQVQMKVPFDRLKGYIAELSDLALIENEVSLKLTQKGKQFLAEYENVLDFMKRMGLEYR
ncbi:MAG: winged helix-turn-helix domain-containing protein [Candidatus Bathyarchaeia archaeon]|jgi:predicted transcriptional regulator